MLSLIGDTIVFNKPTIISYCFHFYWDFAIMIAYEIHVQTGWDSMMNCFNQMDGFVQDWGISSALALEIPQSCTKPSRQCQKLTYLSYRLTLLVLRKHQYAICITSYIIPWLLHSRLFKFTLKEDENISIILSMSYGFWWPGDSRSQGISRHGMT